MKKEEKLNKGITLVALVITIIVLILLSAITMQTLMDNGILEKVKSAKEEHNKEQIKEEIELKIYEKKIEKRGNASLQDIFEMFNNDTEKEYNITEIEGTDISKAQYIIISKKDYRFKINEDLVVTFVKDNFEQIKFSKELQELLDEAQINITRDDILGATLIPDNEQDLEEITLEQIISNKNFLMKLLTNLPTEKIKENSLLNSKLQSLIPTLTSENESSELLAGQCYAEAYSGDNNGYKAFDNNISTKWYLDDSKGYKGFPSLYYNFGKDTCIYKIFINFSCPTIKNAENKFIIYTSNDNETYTEIYKKEWNCYNDARNAQKIEVELERPIKCKYVKIYSQVAVTEYLPNGLSHNCNIIQFYGVN